MNITTHRILAVLSVFIMGLALFLPYEKLGIGEKGQKLIKVLLITIYLIISAILYFK